MRLKQIANNMTVITFANGRDVLFSYETPVATFISGEGFSKTEEYWSKTTNSHITKWRKLLFGSDGYEDFKVTERPQSFFNNLVNIDD